jgi:hypothetical protein
MNASWFSRNKKRILLATIVLLGIIVIYWLFTHSKITVQVQGSVGGEEITYSFRNTTSGEIKQVKTSESKHSAWVEKGSYEVSVSAPSGNFLAFVPSTPVFYRSEAVEGELRPESYREFVGEGLKPCAGLSGGSLVSGGCEGVYGEMSIHKPATKTTSTYVVPNPDRSVFGRNQALITTGDQLVQIIQSQKIEIEGVDTVSSGANEFIAISLNSKLQPTDQVKLSAIDGQSEYKFGGIGSGGYYAFQDSTKTFYEYADDGSSNAKSTIEDPQTQNASTAGIDYINSGSFAALYTAVSDGDSEESFSEAVVSDSTTGTKHYVFSDVTYSDIKLCGTNRLCLLGGESGMDVYDVSGGMARLDFSVPNVKVIARSSDGNILAVNDMGVLNIDVGARQGHMEYSLEGYKFNEINVHQNGYVLRLTDDSGRVVGLYIDQPQSDVDSIDKKRLQLQSAPEVSLVSIYKTFIYVVGDIGEPVYNPDTQRREYNAETKATVAAKINAEIDRLGIDRTKYTITSNAF